MGAGTGAPNRALRRLAARRGWVLRGPSVVAAPSSSSSYDMMGRYVTYHDVTKRRARLSEAVAVVSRRPVASWIRFLLPLSVFLSKEGFTERAVQMSVTTMLAERMADRALAKSILSAARESDNVIFHLHGLAAFAKLIADWAPVQDQDSGETGLVDDFVVSYLILNDHLASGAKQALKRDRKSAAISLALQDAEFMTQLHLRTVISRAWGLLVRVPSVRPGKIIPLECFSGAMGLDLRTFMAMSHGLLSIYETMDLGSPESVDSHWLIDKEVVFSRTAIDRVKVKRYLDRMTWTHSEAPTSLPEGYLRDFEALRDRPLFRVGPDKLAPIYYPYFCWRITEGLFWDIGHDDLNQWQNAFGDYFEQYVMGLLTSHLSAGERTPRIWFERDLPPGKGKRRCDVIIRYPGSYILVEAKAARPSYRRTTVAGEPDAVAKDLGKMLFEPAQQLSEVVDRLKAQELSPCGADWSGETIYPVCVVYGSFIAFDPLWSLLLKDIAEKGLLCQPEVRPLVHLDVDEAEMLGSILKKGRVLPDVLSKKLERPNSSLTFRNFALKQYGRSVSSDDILEDDWQAVTSWTNETLFPETYGRGQGRS